MDLRFDVTNGLEIVSARLLSVGNLSPIVLLAIDVAARRQMSSDFVELWLVYAIVRRRSQIVIVGNKLLLILAQRTCFFRLHFVGGATEHSNLQAEVLILRNGCATTSLNGLLSNGHILLNALLDSNSLIAFTGGFWLIMPQLV